MNHEWRSLYVFYGSEINSDRLVLNIADIIARNCVDPQDWFFIRYWENGPHIRVRLALDAQSAFFSLLNEFPLRAAQGNSVEVIPATSIFSQEVPYIPETIRYGGLHALLANERLFRVSTTIALKAILAISERPSRRAEVGLHLMLSAAAAAGAYCPAAAFFEGYHQAWVDLLKISGAAVQLDEASLTLLKSQVADRSQMLAEGRNPATLSEIWCRELYHACAEFETLATAGALLSPIDGSPSTDRIDITRTIVTIIYSQMHMINNRIGLSVVDEMSLSNRLK